MSNLKFAIGEKVLYQNNEALIVKIIDLNQITIQLLSSNIIHTVERKAISSASQPQSDIPRPIEILSEQEWKLAKDRFEIVNRIIEEKSSSDEIKQIAENINVHPSTIYRWVKTFKEKNTISALVGKKRTGGKNKSRLKAEIDGIVDEVLLDMYLTSSKPSISKVIRTIKIKCKELGELSPHPNTIRNRIKNLSEEEVLRARYGNKRARDKYEPIKGNFPGAEFPLSVVQIDHTCVDIILVDELYRKPFMRPYLTVAIDVFSRMVVGFHVSFDPPGEMGTGLCIANSILSKEYILDKHAIDGDWPCWGTMATIHLDNAKEFRGNMLKLACNNYGINLEHRPIATPHWGGHVERLLGTFSKEIHNLPGTTFSKISDRENYDPMERASLTINEFEKWLVTYIVKVYHKKNHSTLGMPPIEKYRKGIFGDHESLGSGLPPKLMDERRVRLDFMPFFERTIQEYGVLIEHITYYDDVLRKYIHAKEDSTKYSKKQKFIFKRDPRDISLVYFYDPNLNEYFEIPYRDTSKPPISIWEFNEVVKKLSKENLDVNEDTIFEAYKVMEEIELKAIRETKKLKRFSRLSDKRNEDVYIKSPKSRDSIDDHIEPLIITPFDDIEDDAFTS